MEFWGVEVKSGESVWVTPEEGMVVHVSQACLGELKKKLWNESVYLFVQVDGKKLVLGTLSSENLPQQQYDLVFGRSFKLSHNWKNGSVYFHGYIAHKPFDELDDSEEGEYSEKSNAGKNKVSAAGKKKVKIIVEPKKEEKPEADYESSQSDEDSIFGDDDDDDDEDKDDSDESDEETPKKDEDDSDDSDEETPKAEPSKKRPAVSAAKTPPTDKKTKANP